MASLRDALGYLLSRHGCANPFLLSRVLVLANWRAMERLGRPIALFRVEGFEAGFSIPDISGLVSEGGCFEKREEERCIAYTCEPPEIPEEEARILDEVYEQVKDMDVVELNRLVIRDPRYRELLERGGFTS